MRLVDSRGGREIDEYGSTGARFAAVARTSGWSQVGIVRLQRGGRIGSHSAPSAQLFLVVAGEGVVVDGAGNRIEVWPGRGVMWDEGEAHETESENGLTALVVEAESIDEPPASARPT